jgi:signal transduction histidine kinase/CheY-like chemotaxis protein
MAFSTRASDAADAPRPSDGPSSSTPMGGPGVAVVDTDAARAEALAKGLREFGFSVAVVGTSEVAAILESRAPVVLLRRRPGGDDGFGIAREITRRAAPPRVLILGDAPNVEDTLRAVDASASGILFEPHEPARVAARIRKATEAPPMEPTTAGDSEAFRVRGTAGVVYKMRARPELLVEYLVRATEDLARVPSSPALEAEVMGELRDLRNQVRLSNEILDRVPAIVLVTDPQGRVAYAGPGVGVILGYESSEALGEGFWNRSWPDFAAAERMRSALMVSDSPEHGQAAAFEAKLRAPCGTVRDIAFQFGSGPGGTRIVVGQDVTARKTADAARDRARKEASDSAALRSDFLVKLGEEIEAPMNAVVGMTSMLLDTDLSSDQRDCAEVIRTNGEALLALIADTLDFSRIESGAFTVERQRCSVEELVDQCLDLMAARAAQKGLDLAGAVEAVSAIEFLGDGPRIRQILVNLLSNAVAHTESGGVLIDVRLLRQERGTDGALTRADLVISVTDTGAGIPADRVDHLFRPFPRIDASSPGAPGGTGLGLAISSELASAMGGSLSVESTLGEGSRFTLSLPVEIQGRSRAAHHEASGSWLSGRRILLTTAGPMTTDVITRLVSRWGGTLVRASLQEAASRLGRGEVFAAALIDHSGAADGLARGVSDSSLRTLKEACARSGVPVISLRPAVAVRPMVATQGLSVVSTTAPVKAASLYRALQRAVFGAPAEASRDVPRHPPLPTGRLSLSILVAEHNVVDQKVARLSLLSLGFSQVDVVKTGPEAIGAMAVLPYDIVLLDLHLPGTEALEVARVLRSRGGGGRPWIVALTTRADPAEREAALAAGVDDFAAKPLQRDDLAVVMDRARSALVS